MGNQNKSARVTSLLYLLASIAFAVSGILLAPGHSPLRVIAHALPAFLFFALFLIYRTKARQH